MAMNYFFYLCLIITAATKAAEEESSVEVSVKQLNVPLGGTGSVTCSPGGSPLPQIQWKKHGGELGPGTKQAGNTLIISNAQIGDRGYYMCGGIVDRKAVTQQYVLVEVEDVQSARPPQSQQPDRPLQRQPARAQPQTQDAGNPRVKVSVRQLTIATGQSGTVDCTPEGSPQPRIQWNKAEGEFNSRVRPNGNALVITNAQDGDGGNYVCNGLVDATAVWAEYVQVVIVPSSHTLPLPYRADQLPKPVDVPVAEGQDIKISCDFKTGDDQQIVSWSRLDQRPLPENVQQNGRDLIFQRATTENAADYLCKVTGGGFLLRQLYLRLTVLALPRVTIRPERPTVTRGEELTVECMAEGNAQVSWERVDGAFSSRAENRGAQLVFRNIEVEDSGSYRCIAGNEAGDTTQSTQIVVNDIPPPQPQIQPPQASARVTVNVRQLKIARGESRTVDCTPEGTPLPRVQWSKREGEFSNGVVQDGTKLTITNAQDGDAGDYVCIGIVQDTPVWTDYLQVVIEDVPQQPQGNPRVTISEPQVRIPRGGSKKVECVPEGSPLPRVRWTKEEGDFGEGVEIEGSALIISNAQEADSGNYLCSAIVQATSVATAYLQLLVEDVEPVDEHLPSDENPPKVKVSESQVKITEGQSKTIDCIPEGEPLPTVQWTKEEGEFSSSTRQEGNSLVISEAKTDDRGYYICNAVVDSTTVYTDYLTVEVEGNAIDKSACKLALETSWCYGVQWYYDINAHKCVSYAWGGCGGNANKFESEEACSLACDGV